VLSAALLLLAAPVRAALVAPVIPVERAVLAGPSAVLAAPLATPALVALTAVPMPAPALAALPAAAPLAAAAYRAAAPAPTAAPALADAPPSAASVLRGSRPPSAGEAARAPAADLKSAALDFFVARDEAPPVDATASLKDRQRAVREGRAGPMPASAGKFRYLFVPGFSWDALHDYFGPNIRRLRAHGLDARMVPTDPLGTTAHNAEALRLAIEASDKPVVLIGHSKGGLDALKALKLYPGLQANVAKLITLQTPYRGTAIADYVLKMPFAYATMIAYSRLLNLSRLFSTVPFFRRDTVAELTPDGRRAENADRAPLRRGLKLYSVVSRVDDKTAVKILLFITAGAMRTLSGRHNDGLVAPEDGVLPGARYALLEHVGHLDTVAEPASWKHKALGVRGHDPEFAADLTEAIVRWVFAR
jgi:triacylglycerol lipase